MAKQEKKRPLSEPNRAVAGHAGHADTADAAVGSAAWVWHQSGNPHALGRQGWVHSEWKLAESNQRAKYYRITLTGKKQLASDHSRWQQLVEAIGAIMHIEPEQSEP